MLRSLYLLPIHTSKTCFDKLGLTEWKSEIENWKPEFSTGLNGTNCIFNVLNLKSTNVGWSSFYGENKVTQNLANIFETCLNLTGVSLFALFIIHRWERNTISVFRKRPDEL